MQREDVKKANAVQTQTRHGMNKLNQCDKEHEEDTFSVTYIPVGNKKNWKFSPMRKICYNGLYLMGRFA